MCAILIVGATYLGTVYKIIFTSFFIIYIFKALFLTGSQIKQKKVK
jgi:hypothetical protein